MSRGLGVARQLRRWVTQALRMRELYASWATAATGKLLLRGNRPRAFRLLRRLDGAPIDLLASSWHDIRIINEIYLHDPYLRRLPPGIRQRSQPLVVDLGANRGYFCVQAAASLDRPRIVAYEPEPGNLSLLAANLALNGLSSLAEVVPAAATDDDRSEATLHLASAAALHTMVSPDEGPARGIRPDRYVGRSLTVPARNIDRDLRELVARSGQIHVLKIDTEGTEAELLASLSDEVLAAVQYIAAESHWTNIELDPVLERLATCGFSVFVDGMYLYAWREVK